MSQEVMKLEPPKTPAQQMLNPEFTEFQFTPITEYGWEDINENTAKVYITKNMEGIKQLDPSQIQCEFEPMSIDLKIRDFKGKNWRFKINPVNDSLAVEKCQLNVKSNSLSIRLEKENPRKWTTLKWVKPMTKDGMAHYEPMRQAASQNDKHTLNTLMKDLYASGSPEIKQLIEQSFEKSQQEKQ